MLTKQGSHSHVNLEVAYARNCVIALDICSILTAAHAPIRFVAVTEKVYTFAVPCIVVLGFGMDITNKDSSLNEYA
jgi:hypothetical protein